MEDYKQITVNYQGSMVKATKIIAWAVFILGIFSALIWYLVTDSWNRDDIIIGIIAICAISVIWLVVLLAVSKILENLWFLRKVKQSQLFYEGYDIREDFN